MDPKILRAVTDWTNVAAWSQVKLARADDDTIVSLYWTATESAAARTKGKKIVCWQPGILFAPDGTAAGAPYNLDLYALASKTGALMSHVLHETPEGVTLRTLDLTRRGFVAGAAAIRAHYFGGWAGHHLDYFAGVRNWNIPNVTEDWCDSWDRSLAAFTKILRLQDPECLIIGQSDRLTGDMWSATSGCYIEQSPTFNGRTLLDHAADLKTFRESLARFAPDRPLASICELRDPWRYDDATLAATKAWIAEEGMYLSEGRDNTSVGA